MHQNRQQKFVKNVDDLWYNRNRKKVGSMNSTQSQKQHQLMTQTPIPKLVSSLAIPTTIGMLITVIYNTADTYFVSQINKSASAAVGAVYAIMAIIQPLGLGIFGVQAAQPLADFCTFLISIPFLIAFYRKHL